MERKHGKLGRVWVFDRGIVSEENLNLLRSRGASYLMATPKRLLTQFQKDLVAEDWSQVANHPQIQVKRIEREGELYVLTRSLARAEKERAMRQRVLKGLRKDLAKLSWFAAGEFAGRKSFTHGSDDSQNVGPRRGLTSKPNKRDRKGTVTVTLAPRAGQSLFPPEGQRTCPNDSDRNTLTDPGHTYTYDPLDLSTVTWPDDAANHLMYTRIAGAFEQRRP